MAKVMGDVKSQWWGFWFWFIIIVLIIILLFWL